MTRVQSSRRRTLLVLAGALLVVAVAVAVLTVVGDDSSGANSKVRGAAALPDEPTPQETAPVLVPSPERAPHDHSPVVADGCMVGKTGTRSHLCVYGDPHGKWTVVLFGDSHAAQYFTPLKPLAVKNHWRLVVLNKRECTPADAHILREDIDREYHQCDAWHESALRRIKSYGPHTTVVLSGDKSARAVVHGRPLSGAANATAMEHGYAKTLTRIRDAGIDAVVIQDMPSSPKYVPGCVAQHRSHLRECAFERPRDANLEFDAHAARAVPGVRLLDLIPEVCPHDLCRAVIGNALVYRDKHHLTATYARTLTPWIAAGLRAGGVPFRGP